MGGGYAPASVVVGVVTSLSVLSYICVTLRIWTRFRIQHAPGLDDALIVIAMAFNIVMCFAMIMQANYGLGRHITDLSPHELKRMLFYFWLSIWSYYGAQGFAKLSILWQYLRIFGHVRNFQIACHTVIFLSVFYVVWGIFTSIFICWPVSGWWHPEWQESGKAKCTDIWHVRIPIWFFNAGFNILTDILIAVIPLPVIGTLNLPKKQRIVLMGVFSLGGCVCIISIIRISGLWAVAVSKDPTYDNCLAAMWSATEASVTTIAGCLPVLKGLLGRLFPSVFKTSRAASSDRYGGSNSNRSHSKLSDLNHSSHRAVWGKKTTTVHVEENISENHSPQQPWGWSEDQQANAGGIQMKTIVERTGEKSKFSAESRENLVPTLPIERP